MARKENPQGFGRVINMRPSRFYARGINPETGNPVEVAWGVDKVLGIKGGFFFQVYDKTQRNSPKDKDGSGLIVDEGQFEGLGHKEFNKLCKEWQVDREANYQMGLFNT
jgi:hypothetical protein